MPFVSFCLAFLLLHNLFYQVGIYSDPLSFYETILGGVKIVIRLACFEPLMGAMWFCSALLIVSLLSFGIMKITKGNTFYVRLFVFVGAMAIGAICCYFHIKSPYCLWQNIQICMIFYMGFVFRHIEGAFKSVRIRLILIVISVVLVYIFTRGGIMAHLQPNNISNENVFFLMLIALVGCIGVYSISSLLSEMNVGKMLAIVGDYSFSIMALHFFAFKVIILIQCFVFGQSLSKLSLFPCFFTSNYWWVAYVLAGVLLPIIASKCYHLLSDKLKENFDK